MDLDDATAKLTERNKQFKKRHTEMHTRFLNNIPSLQAKDWQQNHQLGQRLRNQPAKSKSQKQYDMHKLVNATTEQQNNTTKLNGGFNSNDILQNSPQKRPYEQFNGGNTPTEEHLNKMSRINDVKKQQFQNAHKKNATFELGSTVQPNVNPFQINKDFLQKDSTNLCTSTAVAKTSLLGNVSLSNSILNNISESSPDISNINNLVDSLKKSDSIPDVKTESPNPSSCNVISHCPSLTTQTKIESSNSSTSNFNQFQNDPILEDLDSIERFALFGEITGNTRKTVKVESNLDGDVKVNEPVINNEQKNGSAQQKWNASPKDQKVAQAGMPGMNTSNISRSTNPLANLNQMASMQSATSRQVSDTTTQQQMNQSNQKQQMIPSPQQLSQTTQQQLIPSPQQMNQNAQQQMNQSKQQMNPNTQQMNQSTRPINLDSIDNGMTTSPISQQNLKNLMASKAANAMNSNVSSPLNMMQSPKNPLHSPINIQSTLNSHPLSPQMAPASVQAVVPPNLPRHPNMRQHLANHINKQQQPMMPNMPSMNNPYMQAHSVPTTTERLQEHLKRKEQFRIIEMQHQMSKTQLMNQHLMSPVQNPMPQANPFQFPNNFPSYNQQKAYQQMNMQSQQNPAMGFYPPPYMDGGGSSQMFSGAPPGYNQQNRAGTMLRNIMRDRDRQQMAADMYNSVNRQSMEQQAMFNPATKAPPQYPSQDMNPPQMDPQQMMMQSNPSMQSPSRLTHFSQPDTSAMGMSAHSGMNPAQVRMRSPMNPMSRYPAPPLSRPLSMQGNEGMNSVNSNQFGSYGNTHMASIGGMTQNNPNFSTNMTSEQLLYLQTKKRQQLQQQQQQRQFLMQQRQQQQQNVQQQQQQQQQLQQQHQQHQHQQQQQQQQQQQHQQQQQQQQQNIMQQQTQFSPISGNNILGNRSINPVDMMNDGLDNGLSYNTNNQTLQQPTPTPNIPANMGSESSPLSHVNTNKNVFSTESASAPATSSTNKQTVNLNPITTATTESATDEETDLDNLLNNPPDSFDLVEMFSS